MKTYTGTKTVTATPMNRRDYNTYRGWELPSDENGDDEGYLVEYAKGSGGNVKGHAGYVSWSPKTQFEEAYRLNGELTFGDAVRAMKEGKRVARSGWNGKGMFLWLLPAATIPKAWIKDPQFAEVADEINPTSEEIEVLGSIRMKTAGQEILTGWLASQSDILAEDWEILD